MHVELSYHDGYPDTESPLTNPGLGDLKVIHIDDYETLDSSDYDAPSIGNDPGVLISGTETPNKGYVSIDVKAAMQDDINNNRAYTTYRLEMETETDNDQHSDLWRFTATEYTGDDYDPYIDCTYTPPQGAPEFPSWVQPILIVAWSVLFIAYVLRRRLRLPLLR